MAGSTILIPTREQLANFPPAIVDFLVDMATRAKADVNALDAGGVAGTSPVHVVDLCTAAALAANTYNGTAQTITLSATGTLTVDSVLTVLGDRILVKDEGNANCGIYKVTTAGAGGGSPVAAILTRELDWNATADVQAGMLVGVKKGTVNTGLVYLVNFTGAFTLDTTTPTFTLEGGTTAGIGLAMSSAGVLSALENAVVGTAIPDDAVAILISAGQWRVLAAATLTANRSKALSMTGATAGKQIIITKLDVSAFTFTVTDAGPGTPTLCVMPAGWVGSARFQSDGTNWFLKEIGALPSSTSRSSAADQFGQAMPVYRARGVVLANVANLAAFVVSQNGVTFAAGDIALLANQTTAAECGLYLVGTVAGTAPLTRIAALPAAAVGVNGCTVEISEGTLYAGSTWKAMATTTGGFVVGTNDPLFYPKTCKGTLTLSTGAYTLGSTEGLFVFSTTTSAVGYMRNTAGNSTLTTGGYASPVASRTAGKSATGAVLIRAEVAAGTLNNADTSTIDWSVTNW